VGKINENVIFFFSIYSAIANFWSEFKACTEFPRYKNWDLPKSPSPGQIKRAKWLEGISGASMGGVYLGVKTSEVFLCFLAIFFCGSIVFTPQWLLCIHCFTSLVSFTGFTPKAALWLAIFWKRNVRRFEAAAWWRRSIARAAAKETTDMTLALGVFK